MAVATKEEEVRAKQLEELKRKFEEALKFRIGDQKLPLNDELSAMAIKETQQNGTILLTRNDLTPGMERHCVKPVRNALSQWRQLRGDFFTAIQPFKEDLNARDRLDDELQQLDKGLGQFKDNIEDQWLKNNVRYAAADKERKDA